LIYSLFAAPAPKSARESMTTSVNSYQLKPTFSLVKAGFNKLSIKPQYFGA
jgi:hypothetical protein